MPVYPYDKDLQPLAQNMNKGNFGLWYNKFIPIDGSYKACDDKGNKDNAVQYYHDKYNAVPKNMLNQLLKKKHEDQDNFCKALSLQYEITCIKAKLKTPLITGIGESHPHEVSMVVDHNIGIPYIPSSGIKGIVRFAHTLSLLELPNINDYIKYDKEGNAYLNDEDDWTKIPHLFGTQEKRGSVIFLDAYPETVPDLHVDIMNPHYGQYYNGDGNTPPGDYLDPNPLKFLTVAKDTQFIFRALVDKTISTLIEKIHKAYQNALTKEGVGAKTAVGYGLFEIIDQKGNPSNKEQTSASSSTTISSQTEVWEKATVIFKAQNQQFTATNSNGKQAFALKKDIKSADEIISKLKKKPLPTTVTVEICGNSKKIIQIG
ncbi:MAG: type III-B CRISPR module RAMP protein Cmr6 [Desulfobacterales bacterium]|nr:type III-B CRISPR module RAMP protein Cmr6 [Desulfobacterales bacterium]